MNYRIFFSLLALIFICNCKYAGAESLDETALLILKNSQDFQSENLALQSTLGSLKTQSNLPDPEVSGEYLIAAAEDESNRWGAELTWGLEWPGVYGARGKEAKLKMTVAKKRLYTQRVERLAEIKDLLLDFIQCRKKLVLLDRLSQNNDTIFQLAEQAAKGGEMTVLDLHKVKLEYANIRVVKAAVLDEEAEVKGSLSNILGRDCTEILNDMECEFPEISLPSIEELELIKTLSPEVNTALAEAESIRASRSVAKMESLPSVSFGYKHAFEDGIHFNGALLGISLPLFSSRGRQKAVKAEILEAEYKTEMAKNQVETETMQISRQLKLLDSQIREISPLVENADYNAALLKAYKGGVITLIEYITDRNYFTNAEMELLNLRLAAAKTQTKLQKYLIPVSF